MRRVWVSFGVLMFLLAVSAIWLHAYRNAVAAREGPLVFLLIGGTGMAGCSEEMPDEYMLPGNCEMWVVPEETRAIGPEASFVQAVSGLMAFEKRVVVIRCAVTGSTADDWNGGEPYHKLMAAVLKVVGTKPARMGGICISLGGDLTNLVERLRKDLRCRRAKVVIASDDPASEVYSMRRFGAVIADMQGVAPCDIGEIGRRFASVYAR